MDFESFLGSMRYESSVAMGTMTVFYTGEFIDTLPVIFQLQKVFPFLLNPIVLPFALISFFYVAFVAIRQRKTEFVLLVTTFCILFFSQAFLFVKWTRYMLPTLPFIYLMIAIFFHHMLSKKSSKPLKIFFSLCLSVVIASSVVFSLSYVKTVFIDSDTRILAKEFAGMSISSDSRILSEVYDLGITPFNDDFKKISLFDFYGLDLNSQEVNQEILREKLGEAEFIVLPSQRILATRTTQSDKFPVGNKFYNDLFTDTEKFTLIYETPCDIFCKITYFGDPVKRYEGTASVFDRPHVMIFKIHAEK
jgi:hypothetical protein